MSIITSHTVTLEDQTDQYRIILRPLRDEHLNLLYKWNSDPEVLYWTEGGEDIVRSYDEETVRQIYGGVSKEGHCFLVEASGIPIGECWLQRMNLPNISALYPGKDVRRMDMAIGEKSYWGKGIGTKLISMLMKFAFTIEGVDVLHCFAEDYNKRSQRVWMRNGFRLVRKDELKQPQKGKEQYHFAMFREEYTETQRRLNQEGDGMEG